MIHAPAKLADGGESVPEPVRELLGEYGENGTLSIATGAVSVARGVQLLRTNRKRGALKLLFGAGWIAVGLLQRQRSLGSSEEDDDAFEGPIGEDEDVEDVTPGETDDEMAASNTLPPSGVGEPEGHDTGETDPTETAAEPAEMTGPTEGDAAPATDKTTVPDEPPADDVSMAGDDESDDEAGEGRSDAGSDDETAADDDEE
ncbi:hypothetical protein [Natrononativus amylolyticus]|uniref:hypothetical protein n=1 Tax=Natrononativus amylolyticus TaxID=2963434 RepID=UPI0020CEC2BB|nr:hypothetical protein [Natrononativus amylolyticus]